MGPSPRKRTDSPGRSGKQEITGETAAISRGRERLRGPNWAGPRKRQEGRHLHLWSPCERQALAGAGRDEGEGGF